MLSIVTPNLHLASVLDVNTALLGRLGLEGLLLDVDCTLKDHGAPDFPGPVKAWAKRLQVDGIRLCLLSNGKPRRIGGLARQLDVPFVAAALKPLPWGCLRGLEQLGLPRHRVAVVGDQLFADVLAGRLAGLFTILLRPTSPVEPWFTRLKRPVERRVLRWINLPEPPLLPRTEQP
jgi:HAD superfamily phosphatase (TIGR01668 family)